MITAIMTAVSEEPIPMKATYYLPTGHKTASGTEPEAFKTVASAKKYIGLTAAVYKREEDGTPGEFYGFYSIEDTGGPGVKDGRVLDFFIEDPEDIGPTEDILVYLYDARG